MDIKTITDNVKAIKEIADATQNLELKSLIIDLKEQVLELREENHSLKEQLSKKTDYNMQFENNAYWNIKEDETKDGPFCSACWDNHKKAVRMKAGQSASVCPVCKNTIYNKSSGNNGIRITL